MINAGNNMKTPLLTILLCLPAFSGQPDIIHGCLTVKRIHLSRWDARCHGLMGIVENHCAEAVSVTITAGYFNRRGEQLDSNVDGQAVPAGELWRFCTPPTLPMLQIRKLKSARVTKVTP